MPESGCCISEGHMVNRSVCSVILPLPPSESLPPPVPCASIVPSHSSSEKNGERLVCHMCVVGAARLPRRLSRTATGKHWDHWAHLHQDTGGNTAAPMLRLNQDKPYLGNTTITNDWMFFFAFRFFVFVCVCVYTPVHGD